MKRTTKKGKKLDESHYEATLDPQELDSDDGTIKKTVPDEQVSML
jgi:hypothetical protein